MRVRLLVAGLAASVAARWVVPLAATDPLRETLVWLPALAAGWAVLERTPGARRLPRRARRAEGLALAALALLALLRPRLELPFGDALAAPILAAGLVLILGHRAARTLGALRPLLGRRLPRRPAAAFFLLALLVYLSILPWATGRRPPDGDEPYYLLIAHSLAYDGDVDLDNNYRAEDSRRFVARALEPQPGDPVGRRGERYSRHSVLLPLVLAAPYRLGGLRGAQAALCAMAAALVWATLRLARHYAAPRPGEALLAVALAAFTAPLLLFSHQAWVEVPAALATVVGLDAVLTLAADPGDRPARLVLAASLLALPLLKLRFAVIAVGLLAVAHLRWRRPSRLAAATAGLLLLVGALLVVNFALFGNPLKYQPFDSLRAYAASPARYLRGGVGLLWDCAFGLFAASPMWLLLVPALARRALRPGPVLADGALTCGPYLLAILPRGEWYGAWSPAFRYGVVAVPLLALFLVPLLADRRRAGPRVGLEALGLVSLALTVLWCVRPEWTYNLADGRSHLLDALGSTFGADFARLTPSSIRPRSATWGWVAASLLVLPALWGLGRRPSRGRGWGALLAFLGCASLLVGAERLPTRVVEFEDAWLAHQGGALHPERWVVARLRFRGAWAVPSGSSVAIPVVPGGRRVRLVLEARELRPPGEAPHVVLRAGDRELGSVPLSETSAWQTLALGPVEWPPGARRLEVSVQPAAATASPTSERSGALLDRMRLEWER